MPDTQENSCLELSFLLFRGPVQMFDISARLVVDVPPGKNSTWNASIVNMFSAARLSTHGIHMCLIDTVYARGSRLRTDRLG